MNTASRPSSRVRALLAALLTTLLVASGLSLTAMPANAAAGDVAGATLDWGIKASFRNYIAGPIAHGKWTVDGGVSATTPFAWSGGTGAANTAASTGSVGYPGSVHFQGHEALLLHAQEYVAPLYAKAGFEAFGAPYDEAGIAHISMYRAPVVTGREG